MFVRRFATEVAASFSNWRLLPSLSYCGRTDDGKPQKYRDHIVSRFYAPNKCDPPATPSSLRQNLRHIRQQTKPQSEGNGAAGSGLPGCTDASYEKTRPLSLRIQFHASLQDQRVSSQVKLRHGPVDCQEVALVASWRRT